MPITLKAKPAAEATTTKVVKDKKTVLSDVSKTEKVEVPTFSKEHNLSPEPWCEVGVDASYTHNLGNFQSCRVGVTLKIPCHHPEIDEVFTYAQDWVDGKMNSMMADLQSS